MRKQCFCVLLVAIYEVQQVVTFEGKWSSKGVPLIQNRDVGRPELIFCKFGVLVTCWG